MNKNNIYIGARYVPILIGQWDATRTYEPLMIVQYQGNSFTSKTYVPIGASIDDETYWASTGNYNAQVEYYRQETKAVKDQLNIIEGKIDSANAKIILLETDVTTINEKIIVIEAALVDLNKVIDNVNTNLTKKINDDILTLSTSVTTRFSIQDIKLINVEAKLTQDINYVRAYSSKNDIPGDGITNCTPSFNKCINAYKNVYFDADEGTLFKFDTNPVSVKELRVDSKYPIVISVPTRSNPSFEGVITNGNISFLYRDSATLNNIMPMANTENKRFDNTINTGFHGINSLQGINLKDQISIKKISSGFVVDALPADYNMSNTQNIITVTKDIILSIDSGEGKIFSCFVDGLTAGDFAICGIYDTNKLQFMQYGTGATGFIGMLTGTYTTEPYKRPWISPLSEPFKPDNVDKRFGLMVKQVNDKTLAMYVNGIYCGDMTLPNKITSIGVVLRTPSIRAICFTEMYANKIKSGITPRIKYFGDSLGTSLCSVNTPTYVIGKILTNKYGFGEVDNISNISTSGLLMSEICARATADGLSETDICIIQGGTNDITAGTSLTKLQEAIEPVYNICKDKGVKLVLVLPPPKTNGGATDKWIFTYANLTRVALNLSLLTPFGSNLVYTVIEQICPTTPTERYTTPFIADGVHFTSLGLYNFCDNIANTIVNTFVK